MKNHYLKQIPQRNNRKKRRSHLLRRTLIAFRLRARRPEV
jgi:hypothetical protein